MIPLLRNIKIPFHTTNGPEKTIPPPKKQRIYPISADGAVWEQSNQTISISSLLQLATYLNQHQAPELQFFTLLRAFWHHGGWSSCRHTVQQYRDRKCKSKIKSAFTLLYRLQLLVFVYSATWARWKKEANMNSLKVIYQQRSESLCTHSAQHLASLFSSMKCFWKWTWVAGWMLIWEMEGSQLQLWYFICAEKLLCLPF